MITLGLILSFSIHAMSTQSYYQISQVFVWEKYNQQGAILIQLKNQDANSNTLCPGGYWVDDTSNSNTNLLSTILSAYHANTKVMVYANENIDFSGMSIKQCKIQLIKLEPK